MEQKTELFAEHKKLNASLVEFAGFLMPVRYDSIISEHLNVRNNCGVFDVSHMGQFQIKGCGSEKFVQYLIANDLSKLAIKKILYSPILNHNGGIIDDVLVYKQEEDSFLLVVNAANIEKDYNWINAQLADSDFGELVFDDLSSSYSMLALQGPMSFKLMDKIGFNLDQISYYGFDNFNFQNKQILVSKTGYTGEQGVEIIIGNSDVVDFWHQLMKEGQEFNIKPIGLGARDTLRLEVCFSLYGHELKDNVSPFESGIGWAVDMNKEDFIGKTAILNNRRSKKLVGFEMIDRGIARESYQVFDQNYLIGTVTSGAYLPLVKKNMGLALVKSDHAVLGKNIYINIRSKKVAAKIVNKPFVLPFNRRKN